MAKERDEQEQHEVVALTTRSEATLDTFAALSNMVPLLGGAIGSILSGLSNDRKLQRVNQVLWAMSEDIQALSEESEKYVTTDEFKDLLDETLHKVYEERSEQKRRLYKEFLVDEIREPWRSSEDQHRFLRTLEAVQPAHIVVLRALLALGDANPDGRAMGRGIGGQALQERLEGMDPNVQEELLDELIALALVRNQGLEAYDANFSAVLTRYGTRFISYIAGKEIEFSAGATAQQGRLGGRFELVQRELDGAPEPVNGLAQLVMLVRPLGGNERLLEPVLQDVKPAIWLEAIVQEAQQTLPFSEVHYLGEVANRGLWHRRIGAWIATTDVDGSARPGAVKILRVEDDGTIHLFLDRVGARRDEDGPVLLFERAVAETVIHVCAMAAAIYTQAAFEGPVIVGVGLRGLLGSESWALNHAMRGAYPLIEAAYRKEVRTDVAALRADPMAIARELTTDLIEALTQRQYDPFAAPLA
jgi:hypothetical protein